MASLNLAGKTSGYVKLQAPDDSSNNPTVTLPTESGELALKSDIGEGGDVVAQPPVAFNLQLTSSTTTKQGVNTPIVLDKAVVDTDNGLKDGGYEVQKEGLYDISYTAKVTTSDGNLNDCAVLIYVNDDIVIRDSDKPYRGGSAPTGSAGGSLGSSAVLNLKKGDVVKMHIQANTGNAANTTVPSNALSLSGHMVSSFTEGSGGDSATLESLGIPNHDKIEVSENGHTKFTKPVTIRNEGGEALRFERTDYDVMDLNLSEDGFRFRNVTTSTTPVLINSSGKVNMTAGLGLTNLPTAGTPSNLYISPAGTVHLSTATSYSAEDVDKKLAIKDKLIEKLSERLDALEKKLKK